MADIRPVMMIIGVMVMILGAFMIPSGLVDFVHQNTDAGSFAISMLLTELVGMILFLSARGGELRLNVRTAFLATTSAWTVLGLLGAIPFLLVAHPLSFTDAVFETVSGMTTTGSTVMSGLDSRPEGILLWRAMLQWMGGIGIVVTALAILPMLKVGGMQLLETEGFDPMGKILPRAGGIALGLAGVYVSLTMLCASTYWILGMSGFDAICLSMTTLSTGGFANSDQSFAAYSTNGMDIASSIFMIAGGSPFMLFVLAINGKPKAFLQDSQFRTYLAIIATATLITTMFVYLSGDHTQVPPLRAALFNVVSIVTSTGFALGNFENWGPAVSGLFFFLMFVGGCAGSTTGAIKTFRIQVAFEGLRAYLRRMLFPHKVSTMFYNGKPLADETLYSVLGFIFAYFACFAAISMAMSLMGLDARTALSSTATAMGNMGPGLGEQVGPSGNFAGLPAAAKWLMALAMLLGRLEIFTVLVLFTPRFWRS